MSGIQCQGPGHSPQSGRSWNRSVNSCCAEFWARESDTWANRTWGQAKWLVLRTLSWVQWELWRGRQGKMQVISLRGKQGQIECRSNRVCFCSCGLSQRPTLVETFSAHYRGASEPWTQSFCSVSQIQGLNQPSCFGWCPWVSPRLPAQSLLFEWINIARSQNSTSLSTSLLST